MTKLLPWKTKRTAQPEEYEVGHPDYGVLLIKKLGSLTPNEEIEASDYFLNVGDTETLSQAKIEIATQILRSRVNSDWTREDTLSQIESFALVDDLYEFHLNERSRWIGKQYLLKADGSHGYVAASDYAQKYNYLVTARSDIKGSWFVFSKHDLVPQGFDIVLDYTGSTPTAEDSPKKDQNLKLTGQGFTGGSKEPILAKKDFPVLALETNPSG